MNKLFCTFVHPNDLNSVLLQIKQIFSPKNAFILENKTNNEYIITYPFSNKENTIQETVLVHRKSTHNVLYTINALNSLIQEELGYVDYSHSIEWSKYKNTLITFNNQLFFTPTHLHKILEF